jgi:hypothetical protein
VDISFPSMEQKEERYYSGDPLARRIQRPPPDLKPEQRLMFKRAAQAIGLIALGVVVGVWVSPEAPAAAHATIARLEGQLRDAQARIKELEHSLTYQSTSASKDKGRLSDADRTRLRVGGAQYVGALRGVHAQSASQLMLWFLQRWENLLDHPEPDDRVGRRAAALSLLIGGMADNLNPKDYVPWQAEFLNEHWLPGVHYDVDGDGLPAKRDHVNPKDGFANVSICQIAMALNQTARDAQVLVMPEMHCDRPEARMSVFLQGATIDDALDEFVLAVRREGFLALDRKEKSLRLILIGAKPQK